MGRRSPVRTGMIPLAAILLTLAMAATGRAEAPGSFLYQPAYSVDRYVRLPAEAYQPQPGDIFLAVTESWIMRLGHHLAGAADPHHSGIVFARSDGSLAIIEAGPFNTTIVTAWDAMKHLLDYEKTERVYMRRRKTPLTADQSARLTAFCEAQVDKPFAIWRVLAQVTPFRSRGSIRTEFCGKVKGNRDRWFCAELVTEAMVAAGLIDAELARPSATYPRDFFYESSPNPWVNRYADLSGGWHPPALWASVPFDQRTTPPRRVFRLWWHEE